MANGNEEHAPGGTSTRPWWMQIMFQMGLGAVLALLLVQWLTSSVDRKLDVVLSSTVATASAQTQANKEMGGFALEQRRHNELILAVSRQTCRNVAKTDEARDRCDNVR